MFNCVPHFFFFRMIIYHMIKFTHVVVIGPCTCESECKIMTVFQYVAVVDLQVFPIY